MFKVARMSEETGQWVVLAEFVSIDEADEACETWAARFPYAWVDVLNGALALAVD